jgi:hypothetical protein
MHKRELGHMGERKLRSLLALLSEARNPERKR